MNLGAEESVPKLERIWQQNITVSGEKESEMKLSFLKNQVADYVQLRAAEVQS